MIVSESVCAPQWPNEHPHLPHKTYVYANGKDGGTEMMGHDYHQSVVTGRINLRSVCILILLCVCVCVCVCVNLDLSPTVEEHTSLTSPSRFACGGGGCHAGPSAG